MGLRTSIIDALSGHVDNFPGAVAVAGPSGIPVGGENDSYRYVEGKPWFRWTYIPGSTVQVTCGADGQDYSSGLFQIDVMRPSDEGSKPGSLLADSLVSWFKRGTILQSDGYSVTVVNSQTEKGYSDQNWYIVPVSIYYQIYSTPV